MKGFYGFLVYIYSMIATQTLQDNLEQLAVICGIVSAIYTALYFRAAKKRAETETELTRLKIKQRQLGKWEA